MAGFGLVSLVLSKYVGSDKNGTNEANLICYTSACEEDPLLKSFGTSLDQQFSKLKSSLAQGGKTENCALNSAKSVCGFLVAMNQNLAESIIAHQDVFENEELRSLVDLYYESSTSTLDLLNTVGSCTNKAKLSIVTIRIAIQQFETESMDGGNLKKKMKYAKTLEALNKVKGMGDPFGDEYKNQLESVRAEQLMLLKKFQKLMTKLEKKQKKLKIGRRMATMALATVALSFLAVEIYVCILFPPVTVVTVVGTATGLYHLTAIVKKIVNEMRNSGEDLDRLKEVVNIMKDNTNVNIQGTKTINSLVEKLIISLSLILGSVEAAVVEREVEVVKPVMEAIRDEVDTFSTTIKEVGAAVATCSTCVASGKVEVLEHVTKSLSSKGM
ncbi:unnamed protein product [Brassica oleracea]